MKYSCYYIIYEVLIRLQHIYNLWSIHAIILSILDVLWALLCTFILFLGLTYWPRAQCQFLFFPCFWVLHKRNTKRNETFGRVIFGTNMIQRTWSGRQESHEVVMRVEGAPPRASPLPRGPLEAPPTYFFLLYIPTYPQTNRYGAKNLIPPPQLSVSTRSQGPIPELRRRGPSSRRASTSP